MLALGVKPVGAIDWFKERPYGMWPWTKDAVGQRRHRRSSASATSTTWRRSLNLKPDLILAHVLGDDQGAVRRAVEDRADRRAAQGLRRTTARRGRT